MLCNKSLVPEFSERQEARRVEVIQGCRVMYSGQIPAPYFHNYLFVVGNPQNA